jgi:CyaY protein
MDETTFNALTDAVLADLESRLEVSGVDVDFEFMAAGVFEIECPDGSKVIVNRHGAAQEMWVAAKSGGFHFRLVDQRWVDTRDGTELFAKLASVLTQQCGETVCL